MAQGKSARPSAEKTSSDRARDEPLTHRPASPPLGLLEYYGITLSHPVRTRQSMIPYGLLESHGVVQRKTPASAAAENDARGAAGDPAAALAGRAGVSLEDVALRRGDGALGGSARGRIEPQRDGTTVVGLAADVRARGEENAVLAHELVHVAQQQSAIRQAPVEMVEAEAHGLGARLARGEAVRPVLRSEPGTSGQLRFDSFEHQAMIDRGARTADGRARTVVLRASGLRVTAGEVGALLKDFFERFATLDACPRARLEPLLGQMREQRREAQAHQGWPAAREQAHNEESFQRLTAYREEAHYDPHTQTIGPRGAAEGGEVQSYFTRATFNDEHFFGLNVQSGLAQVWAALGLLEQAAAAAHGADRVELERQAEGTVYGAFHGLTDALAPGHMLDAERMRRTAREFWDASHEEILDHLTKAITSALPMHGRAAMLERAVLKNRLFHVLDNKIASIFLKIEHDHFNRQGLHVVNRRGQAWLGFGDDRLVLSPTSAQIGAELVALVLRRFDRFKTECDRGEGPARERFIKDIESDVLDLLPSHVELGGSYIEVSLFANDKKRYLRCLREHIMQDDPHQNELYKLVVENLGLLRQHLEELFDAAQAKNRAQSEQTKALYRDTRSDLDGGVRSGGIDEP